MIGSDAYGDFCQAAIDKKTKIDEDKERRKTVRMEKKIKADEAKKIAEEKGKKNVKGGKKRKTVTSDPDDRPTTSKCVNNGIDTNLDMTAQVDDNVCSICVGEKDDDFTDWIGCDCGKWFHVGCLSVIDTCLKGKTMTEIRGMTYVCRICMMNG